MSDVEHHVADGLPSFHGFVRLHDVLQRKHRANAVLQNALAQHLSQLCQTGLAICWCEVSLVYLG